MLTTCTINSITSTTALHHTPQYQLQLFPNYRDNQFTIFSWIWKLYGSGSDDACQNNRMVSIIINNSVNADREKGDLFDRANAQKSFHRTHLFAWYYKNKQQHWWWWWWWWWVKRQFRLCSFLLSLVSCLPFHLFFVFYLCFWFVVFDKSS